MRPISELTVVNGISPPLPSGSTVSPLTPPTLNEMGGIEVGRMQASSTSYAPVQTRNRMNMAANGGQAVDAQGDVPMTTPTGFGSGEGGRVRSYISPEQAFSEGLRNEEAAETGPAFSAEHASGRSHA